MNRDFAGILAGMAGLGRHRTIELLKAGVARSVTLDVLNEQGLVPPTALCEAYAWRCGSDAAAGTTLNELYLIPGYYFVSLHDAAIEYRSRVGGEDWDASWWPVFADGGGGFFTVVCDPDSSDHGKVMGTDTDGFEPAFASIADLMRTIAQAYEDEIVYVDDSGHLEWDDEAFAKFAAQLNPEADHWRQ